jgi:hypothetical protein
MLPMSPTKKPKSAQPESYTAALDEAILELSSLMAERETLEERIETIDRRLTRLRKAATSIGLLCNIGVAALMHRHPELFPDTVAQDVGLTDAIRKTLKSQNYFFSAVEIREDLKSRDYDITKYKNLLASIHTVLKRLKGQDQVIEGSRGGRTTYRWKNEAEIEEDIPF